MLYDNELIHKSLVLNSTKETIRSIKESGDETLLVLFEDWQNLKSDLAHQYSKPVSKRIANLDSLDKVANQWEELLVRKSSAFTDIRKKVDWQEVRNQLKEGEIAIEYVHFRYQHKEATDSIIYAAMVLTPSSSSPTIISLFVEKELTTFLKREDRSSELEYINQLYENKSEKNLYTLIWSKLEAHLDDIETVYYVPSGLLHQISFNAITTPENSYLGKQYHLIQLNSTRQLVISSEAPQLASMTLFGGIQYAYDTTGLEQNDEQLFYANNQFKDYTLYRDLSRDEASFLPGSLEEVKLIAKSLNRSTKFRLVTKNEATESAFKALSGISPQVLHISTHGFFFPDVEENLQVFNNNTRGGSFKYDDNPLFRSGLTFAGSNYTWKNGYNPYEEEDGILTAYEISNLDLSHTDLVVLSACETGLGDIKGSEGVYGLQRAFKMAGVENLIMSLWKVPDKQTMELMELFYSNWMKGYDIRSAFDLAQSTMSEKYPPYFWAAFVLVGDVVETKIPDNKIPWWVWLASGLILFGFIGWKFRRSSIAA